MVKVKTRKQKGGFIQAENRKAILEFLENSSIEFLNNGSYGFILMARAKAGYTAKIRNLSLRNNKFGKPVKELILKLSFINVNDGDDYIIIDRGVLDVKQSYELNSCKEQIFIDECNITREISQLSSSNYQSICPTYLDHNIIFKNYSTIEPEKQDVANFWHEVYYFLSTNLLYSFYERIEGLRDLKLGIMIMEYMSPYNHILVGNLLDNIDRTSKTVYDKKIKNELLIKLLSMHVELALLGYIHNDLHCNNAFYEPNNTTYYGGYFGRILLLDFGMAHKLSNRSQEEQLKIKAFLDAHHYTEFLQYLYYTYNNSGYTLERRDNELEKRYSNNLLYGYMVGRFEQRDQDKFNNFKIYGGEDHVNKRIGELLQSRQNHNTTLRKFLTKRHNNHKNNIATQLLSTLPQLVNTSNSNK